MLVERVVESVLVVVTCLVESVMLLLTVVTTLSSEVDLIEGLVSSEVVVMEGVVVLASSYNINNLFVITCLHRQTDRYSMVYPFNVCTVNQI